MTMDIIIGYEAEKKRIEGIADVLKNHQKYHEKGIYIPKGLMLTGPAGVGKTLFAKHLAEISGSKLFVFSPSMGDDADSENAIKIKTLFEKAKNIRPSIIFVDEFDDYLPSDYFDSDSRSDFLATILKALDGDGYEGILFIAACVSYSGLPSSVLRSGRIDEHINLSRPDLETRQKIIEYYLSKVDMKFNLNTKALAYKTSGFVGAEIKNLVNMSARLAVEQNKTELIIDDFLESIYSIRNKDIKRENDSKDKYNVAVHEVGHLVVGRILMKKSFDVTIDSYDYVKGMTSMMDDDEEETITSEQNLYVQVIISLAGMASEKKFFGSSSDGCIGDIKKCLKLINQMMQSGVLGLDYVDFTNSDNREEWSDKQRRRVEKKTIKILKKCYRAAEKIINSCLPIINEIISCLMDKTVLMAEESDKIFEKYGI